jgi:hypothetical protein
MATNTPMLLTKTAQAGLLEFQKQCYTMLNTQWNIREQMRQVDLAYIREKDQTSIQQKSKLANRYGDANKFQNITIPVVLPAIESAVVYQASVFLSGNPIFGCVANAQYEDAAMAMEALMENHSTRGGWIRHLQMFFRDGFKYNLSALEVQWKDEVTAALDSDPQFDGGKQGKPKEIIWSGNSIRRLDPYNTIFDTRVPLTEIPDKGEFAGFTELMSRTQLKMFIATLPNKMVDNITAAFESGLGGNTVNTSSVASYYIPPINQDALVNLNIRAGTDWMAWASASQSQSKIQYKNVYEVTTLYARIIPSDFAMRVPAPNTPQVWKFVYINHQILVYAERQTNAHGKLPILFGQPLEDGLSYQTKSLAQNVQPIQELSSAMMNSVIAARRRAISDRGLYDPSRVGEAQINSDNPSAKIPVRPAAYGKPLSEAYFPIPFRDDQSATIMQEMGAVVKLAELISGQNPARQGQFVKGNKTQTEYSDVMNNSNGRDQNTAILLEAQVFTPLKEMLKLNILQYQGPDSLYYKEEGKQVKVDPIALRKATIDFKITDGLSPASKLISADSFQTALQVIGSSPQIGAGYNIGPMFSYMMKTQGAQIADFEKSKEQVAYEQASNQWMQMAQLALSKGQAWNNPQPTPEQFGYLQNGQLKQTDEKPDALTSFLTTIQQQTQTAQPQTADVGTIVPGQS